MPNLPLVDRVLAASWRRKSRLHGESHWYAVTATGLDLAAEDQAVDVEIVFLFGLLHDTRRENESRDPEHGPRAAAFARELHDAGAFTFELCRLELLCDALGRHADGEISDDATVGTCWDADRLHLPRVGHHVNPALLSTQAAREPAALAAASARRTESIEWAGLIERFPRRNGAKTGQHVA